MQNYYQFMIPRLNGEEIRKNFSQYRSLVRKGIAGFIIFGGELETVRTYARKLQEEAELPLIISSDLERGLGQQLKGGTLFPPAMAIGAALKNRQRAESNGEGQRAKGQDLSLIRKSFKAVAIVANYVGINSIFAPVLDINTNPKNPIIAVRAFGEDPATVSLLGLEMIKALQSSGIAACGKHFPGHGDTSIDSHIKLPVLHQDMKRLRRYELKPFAKAIEAGVKMIMLGHLSVPALDPSGTPVSFSKKAVQFLRKDMGYDGLLITDALNMGGIGNYSEEEASAMALEAGVDILLHPSDAAKVAAHLESMKAWSDPMRLLRFRRRLRPLAACNKPSFEYHARISKQLTEGAITVSRRFSLKGTPLLVILNDDAGDKGRAFARIMKKQMPRLRVVELRPGDRAQGIARQKDETMIVAVFSETKAWKGGASRWLFNTISSLRPKADLFVSFGSPYLLVHTPLRGALSPTGGDKPCGVLDGTGKTPCLYAYWDAEQPQEAIAGFLSGTRWG
ncbi:MAG: glycoside hydrolase family 3 N-terminal domain-containing protein [Nitrospirota bacterium]|nr:glycoside hydrolase family 3 N-terminal domain-containing protein [Nitrospirota bacterium]